MKICISNYYNIRFFSSNMIPIAVTQGWPYWLTKNKPKLYLDSNNVLIGIKEFSSERDFSEGFKRSFVI